MAKAILIGRVAMTAMACVMVSACGGGSGNSSSDTSSADTTQTTQAKAVVQTQAQKEADAGRLAKQATFGATPDVISRIVSLGVSGWLDEQFAATGSTYGDIVTATNVAATTCVEGSAAYGSCMQNNFSRMPVVMRFYSNALSQPDQLRQRVALALSELIVASSTNLYATCGNASFNQIFLDNAFGNYRDILSKVTFSPYMGQWLNMEGSSSASPNENYAREFLQLFTIGTSKLNSDGTLMTSSTGQPIANYGPDDIKGVARALTGWGLTRFGGRTAGWEWIDYSKPMSIYSAQYDTGAKTFLGKTVPANASQTDSVNAVIDAAFNNASLPPYVSKFLIQQLVTSNPTPAYVSRVSAVFVNDGNNVRGNMKAVIKAILTDAEARTATLSASYGKVKEPILLMMSVARAAGMVSDGFALISYEGAVGQAVFQAPSVFNFYPPDNPLPQSSTLVSPASKLMTTSTIVNRHNFVYDLTFGLYNDGGTAWNYSTAPEQYIANPTGTSINWAPWEAITDVNALVDRIDLIMLNRTITSAQKTALINAANAITNSNPTTQARLRAQTLIYIVGTSPLFQVDR